VTEIRLTELDKDLIYVDTKGGVRFDHTRPKIIYADYRPEYEKTHCTCGGKLLVHRRREYTVWDIPHGRTYVKIKIKRSIKKCRECDEEKPIEIPFIHHKHQITLRLHQQIVEDLGPKTFTSISEDTGASARMIRHIFDEEMDRIALIKIRAPYYLGADGSRRGRKRQKKGYVLLADVENRNIVGFAEHCNQESIANAILDLDQIENIRAFTSDLGKDVIGAMKFVSNVNMAINGWEIPIVLDRRHTSVQFIYALELVIAQVRGSLNDRGQFVQDLTLFKRRRHNLLPFQRNDLTEWLNRFPKLYDAWRIKEIAFDIYEAKNRDDMNCRISELNDHISRSLCSSEFRKAKEYVNNNDQMVLSYFDHPIKVTNAYTESMHNQIKRIDSLGYGYKTATVFGKSKLARGPEGIRTDPPERKRSHKKN